MASTQTRQVRPKLPNGKLQETWVATSWGSTTPSDWMKYGWKFTPEMDGFMAPCDVPLSEKNKFCNRSSDIDLILFWYYFISLCWPHSYIQKKTSWMVETCRNQLAGLILSQRIGNGKSMGNLWLSHEGSLVFAMESRGFQMFPWSNPLKRYDDVHMARLCDHMTTPNTVPIWSYMY